MAESFREPFSNPYVDESANEARFSAVVTMDEAHERWKRGQWRADRASFDLDESFLSENRAALNPEQSEGNRFAFDLKRDIIDADVDSSRLDGVSYTASYRPQGSLSSNISNLTVDRLKYNALADIKEEIPDDLSYLYGGGSGNRAMKGKRTVKVRRDSRLDTSVDKRRAEVDKMLPERSSETPEMIMADIRRRRDIEDAKSGIVREAHPKRYSRGIYDVAPPPGSMEEFTDASDDYLQDEITDRGSWRSDIPKQEGLVPDSRQTPYFGRFSRKWSEIDLLNPSRSELLRHTVNTIYDDEEPQSNERGGRFRANSSNRSEHYVSDDDFDPYDRYRPLRRQRRQVRAGDNVLQESVMSGEFNNPYVDISSERLQKMLNPDMRGPGHSPDPEGLTDPSLLYEWNMGYSRVNTDDSKYAEWLDEQGRLAEKAEQSRYRGSHRTGRPGAYMQRETPYGEARRYPRGERREREIRRRDMTEQMQKATERGIADGREMIRRQQAEQQKRVQQYYAQQQAYYKKQQEMMMKQQRAYYAQQQKKGRKQNDASKPQQAGSQPMPQQNAVPKQSGAGANRPQYGQWGYYSGNPARSAPNVRTAARQNNNAPGKQKH